jgi:hypothetical protein
MRRNLLGHHKFAPTEEVAQVEVPRGSPGAEAAQIDHIVLKCTHEYDHPG